MVDYGWLTIIAKPLFTLMTWLHSLLGNWGWTIVALTVLIKALFYPLASASYRSMARMKQVARPAGAEGKYGDDKQKLNAAMMEMYRTEKINPLGGCLPMVVQIPVFISLYWVLLASVEMRGAPWILWVHDLSIRDPFFILPAIMMATMFLQIKLNPTPPDPVQAKVMMIMPLVFGGMMFFFPAGLVLYWCVNNTLSILQQWSITRAIQRKTEAAARNTAMKNRPSGAGFMAASPRNRRCRLDARRTMDDAAGNTVSRLRRVRQHPQRVLPDVRAPMPATGGGGQDGLAVQVQGQAQLILELLREIALGQTPGDAGHQLIAMGASQLAVLEAARQQRPDPAVGHPARLGQEKRTHRSTTSGA